MGPQHTTWHHNPCSMHSAKLGLLEQLIMQYDARQQHLCEHTIRRSLGPCQQGIRTGGTSQGCCRFHQVLQASKEKLQEWLEEAPEICVECRIVCGDAEDTVKVDLRQRLSVEGAKRAIVRSADLGRSENEKRGKGARGRESSIGLTGKSLRRIFRPPLSMWRTVKSKGRGGRLRGRGRRRGEGRKTGGGKHEWRKREQRERGWKQRTGASVRNCTAKGPRNAACAAPVLAEHETQG